MDELDKNVTAARHARRSQDRARPAPEVRGRPGSRTSASSRPATRTDAAVPDRQAYARQRGGLPATRWTRFDRSAQVQAPAAKPRTSTGRDRWRCVALGLLALACWLALGACGRHALDPPPRPRRRCGVAQTVRRRRPDVAHRSDEHATRPASCWRAKAMNASLVAARGDQVRRAADSIATALQADRRRQPGPVAAHRGAGSAPGADGGVDGGADRHREAERRQRPRRPTSSPARRLRGRRRRRRRRGAGGRDDGRDHRSRASGSPTSSA